jgi:hypothetical protein
LNNHCTGAKATCRPDQIPAKWTAWVTSWYTAIAQTLLGTSSGESLLAGIYEDDMLPWVLSRMVILRANPAWLHGKALQLFEDDALLPPWLRVWQQRAGLPLDNIDKAKHLWFNLIFGYL